MHRAAMAVMVVAGVTAWGQTQSPATAATGTTATASQAARASAYYFYTLAHMYAELAQTYNNRPDYVNKAIENYKAAIKADPQTPLLSEELSEVYIETGRLHEAEADAQASLKQNPNDLNALRLLARIYMRQIGDSQQNRIDEAMLHKAIEQYQNITRLDPKDVDSWLMLGRLQKVAQNSVDAQNAYKKVLELDPDNEDALTGLAMVYADLGDTNSATALLKKLADKNPSPRSLRALAGAYEQMHEYKLEAETLKRVVDLNPPDLSDVKRELAKSQMLAEQYSDALQTYQALIAEEPQDAESYLRMSQIYLQMKDFGKAREASDKARAIDPDNLEIRYSLVSILEAEGKPSEAIQLLTDILASTTRREYSPQEKAVRMELLGRLTEMYRGTDQTDPAVETLQQMAELDSDMEPRVAAETIDTYRIGKDFTKAEAEADSAIKKWPADRGVELARATLLADIGKTDAAAAEVKKLLGGKNDRETYLSLADIYDKGKRYNDMAKALDAAEKLSQTKEEKIGIEFMRGAMFEKMKKIDASEAEFRKVIEADPKNAPALNYLGFMLADRNVKLPEALDMITKALDVDPNNGAYLDSLGWVYFKLGRLDDAETNLRRALEYTPHDATVRDHLGDVLMRQSKVRDAIAQWQISLKEWEASSPADLDPSEAAKVKSKLESAKVRLAKESSPNKR